VRQEISPQILGHRTGVRKNQRAVAVGNERPAAFEDNRRMVTPLDGGRPLRQQVIDIRRPGRSPAQVRAFVEQPLRTVERDAPIDGRDHRNNDPGTSDPGLANGTVRCHGGNGNARPLYFVRADLAHAALNIQRGRAGIVG
jgi:hypothetical protein